MLRAMHKQCATHMPDAMHERTNELTNAEGCYERDDLASVDAHARVAEVVVLRESRRVGQHEWRRAIRGRMQSPTVFAVAQAVASYTNKDGSKAHPGNERLAADLGCTTKTIQRSLNWLRAEGWLRLDQQANRPQQGRRIAQEWSLTTPEQWTSSTPTVDTGVHPPDPDLHHADSSESGPTFGGARRIPELDINDPNYDSDYAEEWIADRVDGFSGYELTTAGNMLAAGVHPQIIANKILRERDR